MAPPTDLERSHSSRAAVERARERDETNETGYQRRLFLTFVLVAAAFMASSYYAQTHAFGIDAETARLADNGLPSVQSLAAAATDLRRIDHAADDYGDAPEQDRAVRRGDVDRARRSLDAHLSAYLALPNFEGERVIADRLKNAVEEVDREIGLLFATAARGDEAAVRARADREVRRALANAATAVRELMELNIERSRVAAARIHELRRNETRVTIVFDALAAMLAGLGAVVALRAFRRYASLADENRRLLARRADELERFAQHIAHDLVSPLAALTYRLDKIKRAGGQVPGMAEAVSQAKACVQRAQRLTGGVFEFARSGAVPGPGVRADLDAILADVIDDVLASSGEIGAEVSATGSTGVQVGCTPGVLTSVLANLLDNAVKHAAEDVPPRVQVRVSTIGERVRIDVEDRGPGLAPGVEERVFEPYFRADGRSAAGLGLGLATVKRLVEGHSGSVGVQSRLGEGATFWVELPRVDP